MPPPNRDGEPFRIATQRVEACPVCASRATTTWLRDCRDWQQPALAQTFEYDRCTNCGLRFLATRPLPSELGKLYFSSYGPYQRDKQGRKPSRTLARALDVAAGVIEIPSRRRLQRMLDWAYTPPEPGALLVDYGCGAPNFLNAARERGWSTVGIDFTNEVLDRVCADGHRALLVGDEFKAGVESGGVSCVRMNHVIEHLFDPREVLEQIRSKLQPGGRIHIATPNPVSAGARAFGRYWWGLECPRHAALFPAWVLGTLLRQVGFREPRIVYEGSRNDLLRSWSIRRYAQGGLGHDSIAADPERAAYFGPPAAMAAPTALAERIHAFAQA
jgi:2-polyprenyl-3-methyl-5-hydroxy-6-metoxy-1,4-benzoquinol methylase